MESREKGNPHVPYHRYRRHRLRRIGHRRGGRRSRSRGHRAQPLAPRRANPERDLRPGRRHRRGGAASALIEGADVVVGALAPAARWPAPSATSTARSPV